MVGVDQVLEKLATVIDPDLKKDIVSMGMIKDLELNSGDLKFTLELTTPACPFNDEIEADVRKAIDDIDGIENFDMKVTAKVMEGRSLDADEAMATVKNVIGVASGKGGVGKSTVSLNLALALSQTGAKVGLLDADIYGPSMPTMFDVVKEKPTMLDVEGTPMINPVLSYGIKILSIGLFTEQDNAVVWRGPMAAKALTQMFTDAYWGKLDYLLVDLPPGTGDIHLSLVQTVPLDGAVIVSTPQEVALADARKGVNMFKLDSIKVPVLGIIENMAWFTPLELPENKYYIFGRDGAKNLAHGMGVPFLGHVPLVQGVRESGDVGRPAVFQENTPVAEAFDELVRNFVAQIKEPVAN